MTTPKPGPIAVDAHSTREPVAATEGPSSPVDAPSTPCDPQTDHTRSLGGAIVAEITALRAELAESRATVEQLRTQIETYRDALALLARGIQSSRGQTNV